MSDTQIDREPGGWPGTLAAAWGIGGVVALLLFAIWRLAQTSVEAFAFEFDWRHWCLLAGNLIFMAYAEGYKGFQKAYSPRVVARAKYLTVHWTLPRLALAPLFCMAYFHATRRRQIAAWVLTAFIIVLIILFRQFAQPWRGILDAGVVLGLGWGTISIALFAGRWVFGLGFDASPEVPDLSSDAPTKASKVPGIGDLGGEPKKL